MCHCCCKPRDNHFDTLFSFFTQHFFAARFLPPSASIICARFRPRHPCKILVKTPAPFFLYSSLHTHIQSCHAYKSRSKCPFSQSRPAFAPICVSRSFRLKWKQYNLMLSPLLQHTYTRLRSHTKYTRRAHFMTPSVRNFHVSLFWINGCVSKKGQSTYEFLSWPWFGCHFYLDVYFYRFNYLFHFSFILD